MFAAIRKKKSWGLESEKKGATFHSCLLKRKLITFVPRIVSGLFYLRFDVVFCGKMKQLLFRTPVPPIPNPQKQPKNPSCLVFSTTHLEKYMIRQNGLVHLPPNFRGENIKKISEYYHHLQQAKSPPSTGKAQPQHPPTPTFERRCWLAKLIGPASVCNNRYKAMPRRRPRHWSNLVGGVGKVGRCLNLHLLPPFKTF